MKHQYSISEAKNKLPAIIHGIESGKAAQLTRHGKPVAVLISIVEYKTLIQNKANFWDTLTAYRGSKAYDENCFENLRDESPEREFSF